MSEKATFGAGCFWGVEETFRKVPGILDTTVGYAGGTTANPTYKDVCSGDTGHAEVVQVEYDPSEINYQELLNVFWNCHDPTQHNRQGPDIGTQYRSVIFYHTAEQEEAANQSKRNLQESGLINGDIATAIEPAPDFWVAEDYHQRYIEKQRRGHL